MPVRSKWQSLPTEAINPSTLGIDKLSPADIVDVMFNEDRKMLAAVQRERERIAVGVEMLATALRKSGRVIFVGAGTRDVWAFSSPRRCRPPSAPTRRWYRRSWPAAVMPSSPPRKVWRTTTKKA